MTEIEPLRDMAQVRADLDHVWQHFDQIGVDLRQGRLKAHAAILEEALSGREMDARLMCSAVCEIYDLTQACELSPAVLMRVQVAAQRIRKGAEVDHAGAGQDLGRDLIFHLVTGAYLQRAGLSVRLEDPSDVAATSADAEWLVECKRVTSHNALGQNLKSACRQLSQHRRAGKRGIGVVAIDLTRLVNPTGLPMRPQSAASAIAAVSLGIVQTVRAANRQLATARRTRRQDAGAELILLHARNAAPDGVNSVGVISAWRAEIEAHPDSKVHAQIEQMIDAHPSSAPVIRTPSAFE